ncbi:3-beta-hydroxysteroid-Delta(8),Delta(7)-isomerase, partial [Tolypocladium ophioglossoides CBS 100239]
ATPFYTCKPSCPSRYHVDEPAHQRASAPRPHVSMALNSSAMPPAAAQHRYYPPGVEVPGYVANTLSTPAVLAVFCATVSAVLLPTYLAIRRARPGLPPGEVATALWFVLCGFIHLGLEGHFALHAHHIGGLSDVLTQAWKEYSLSDSRYLTRDTFVVCMETVTAIVWGPLAFLCAYGIVAGRAWRHPLQSAVSLGQLYGDVLYYATCTFDALVRQQAYSRPERYYYWGYYVFLNSFWICIPAVLLAQSGRATTRAFARLRGRASSSNTRAGGAGVSNRRARE